MYLELTQNEVNNIPRTADAYIDHSGEEVAATTEQYFWLPLQRFSNTRQIIWVADTTDIGSLDATVATHIVTNIDTEVVTTVNTDYQVDLTAQCLTYLENTDWDIIRNTETGVEVPADILTKRQICRENIV